MMQTLKRFADLLLLANGSRLAMRQMTMREIGVAPATHTILTDDLREASK